MKWRRKKMDKVLQISLDIRVANLIGETWVAFTVVGGVTVRSGRSTTPLGALQSLWLSLNQDEAMTGLEMALASTTMADVFGTLTDAPQLTKGNTSDA